MINVAVLGYGTVGSGVVEVIETNKDVIDKRAGQELHVKYILDLRDFPGDPYEDRIVHDYNIILNDPEVSIICETMGGNEPCLLYTSKTSCGNISSRRIRSCFSGCGMGCWAVIPICPERAAGRSLWRAISSVKGSSNLIRAAPWRKKKASRRGSPCGPLPEAVRASGRCWQRLLLDWALR